MRPWRTPPRTRSAVTLFIYVNNNAKAGRASVAPFVDFYLSDDGYAA